MDKKDQKLDRILDDLDDDEIKNKFSPDPIFSSANDPTKNSAFNLDCI